MTNERRRRVAARLLGASVVGVFFYALFLYLPDFAQAIILLVAVVVIWYDRDFPRRTSPSYATALFWFPIVLGLFCGVVWKITGEEVWVRIGLACICVRAAYRVIDRASGLGF
jgi:hypothetical protein